MKADGADHPKTRTLGELLGQPLPYVIGTLELLWLFAARYADDGAVGRWPDAEIERRCEWEGEAGALIAALLRSGFLDRSETEARLSVHDWLDHAPEYIRKRLRRRTQSLRSPTSASGETSAASGGTTAASVQHTKPSQARGGTGGTPASAGRARTDNPTDTVTPKTAMPDPFPQEAVARLVQWGETASHPWSELRDAIAAVLAWHQGEGSPIAARHRTLRGWEQTVRNALTKGWAADYVTKRTSPRPSASIETDEKWRKERAELKATIDAETDERRRRFPTASPSGRR